MGDGLPQAIPVTAADSEENGAAERSARVRRCVTTGIRLGTGLDQDTRPSPLFTRSQTQCIHPPLLLRQAESATC
jgi:hypothetical protein